MAKRRELFKKKVVIEACDQQERKLTGDDEEGYIGKNKARILETIKDIYSSGNRVNIKCHPADREALQNMLIEKGAIGAFAENLAGEAVAAGVLGAGTYYFLTQQLPNMAVQGGRDFVLHGGGGYVTFNLVHAVGGAFAVGVGAGAIANLTTKLVRHVCGKNNVELERSGRDFAKDVGEVLGSGVGAAAATAVFLVALPAGGVAFTAAGGALAVAAANTVSSFIFSTLGGWIATSIYDKVYPDAKITGKIKQNASFRDDDMEDEEIEGFARPPQA